MTEIRRSGFNIGVALESQARGLAAEADAARREADACAPQGSPAAAALPQTPIGTRARFKQALRPWVGRLFRLLKPMASPLAFRVRAYLLAPMRAEVAAQVGAELRQHLAETMRGLAVLEHGLETLRQDLARHADARALDVIQEIQATRERILGTALNANNRQIERIEQYAYASARRVAVPGAGGEILVRSAVGYILCPADDYALLSILLDAGELEPGTRALIQRLLHAGDCFVDVGANIGMHSLAAAAAVAPGGQIVAFEPHPNTHALLRRSLWMNGHGERVQTHQAAVSDRAGRLPLFLGSTSGHHSLFPLEQGEQANGERVEVPVVTLDEIIPSGTRVDLLKIDAEGAELQVLAGAHRLLRENPQAAVIAEFGLSHLGRTHGTIQAWLGAFEALGMQWRAIDDHSGMLRQLAIPELETLNSVNLMFAAPGSPAWSRAGEHA